MKASHEKKTTATKAKTNGAKPRTEKPSREQIAKDLDDSRDATGTIANPLSELDQLAYEIGVCWHAAASVDGDVGVDLQMMLAELRRRIRVVHNSLISTRLAPSADVDRENLRGLADEARRHVDKLTTLFACHDADLENGIITGAPPARREEFNVEIGGLVACMECIVDDHCGGAEVPS